MVLRRKEDRNLLSVGHAIVAGGQRSRLAGYGGKRQADGHKNDTKSVPQKQRQRDGGQRTTKPGDGEDSTTLLMYTNWSDGANADPQAKVYSKINYYKHPYSVNR